MRHKTLMITMALAAGLLVACNDSSSGSSSSSNGNGDNGNGDNGNGDNGNGQVAVTCDANVDLADNDDGLSRDGHSGLNFFAVADRVCALDADQGTVFEVARSDDGEDVLRMDTHFTADTSGDMVVAGVVYAMDEHLWWADASASAGGVTPRQISSESRMEDVAVLRVESDFQDPDNALVIYRIEDEGWYAVSVDAGTTEDPVALEMDGSTAVSTVAVRDPASSGALQGLLIPQATSFADVNGEQVAEEYNVIYKTIDDLDGSGEALLGKSQSQLGFAKIGQLDNGDLLLWSNFGLHAFNLSTEELTDPNEDVDVLDDNILNLSLNVRYANDGDSLYLADVGPDGPRLTRLYIEGDEPQSEILNDDIIEDARSDVPRFVTTTDTHVVWGYRVDRDIGPEEEIIDVVESVELDGSNPTQYDMDVGVALRDQIADPLTKVYSTGDKVFFNVTPRFIDQGVTVFRAYWLEPGADTDALNYRDNQNWRLGLSDPSLWPAQGLAQQERSEVLIVGRDEDISDSDEEDFAYAVSVDDPENTGVALGQYGADGGPIGPFLLSTADYGVGPGRLAMRSMTSGDNTLYWLDVRHEQSMKPILVNEESRSYRLQPGF